MKKILLLMFLVPNLSLAKLRIAVLDTGVDSKIKSSKFCKDYFEDFTDEGFMDYNGHGTNIVGLIVKNAPEAADYCIKIYKGFSRSNKARGYLLALMQIAKDKPDILNISAGGLSIIKEESEVIKTILDNGTIIVAAAGNEYMDLSKDCSYYPACLDKRIIVVANGKNGIHHPSSNFNGPVDVMLDGVNQTGFNVTFTGTSQSTAKMTGILIGLIYNRNFSYKEWTK